MEFNQPKPMTEKEEHEFYLKVKQMMVESSPYPVEYVQKDIGLGIVYNEFGRFPFGKPPIHDVFVG